MIELQRNAFFSGMLQQCFFFFVSTTKTLSVFDCAKPASELLAVFLCQRVKVAPHNEEVLTFFCFSLCMHQPIVTAALYM